MILDRSARLPYPQRFGRSQCNDAEARGISARDFRGQTSRQFKRGNMRVITGAVLMLLMSCAASAQDMPAKSLEKRTWELGLFGGGGTGLNHADDTRFFYAGGRVGRVLTGEHFSGLLRGNFEWAADFMPAYVVVTPGGSIYGGSFKPVIWQWNFTSGRKISPYIAIAGGVLFSTNNVPPGNTSYVNFTPQGAFGAHVFLKRDRALLLEGAIVHHSNASLGTQNPGYNAALFLTVGYSWFKGGK